jgi:hypothetical protein
MEKRRGELELTRRYLYLRPRPPLRRGRLQVKEGISWGTGWCGEALDGLDQQQPGFHLLHGSPFSTPSAAVLGLAASESPPWTVAAAGFFVLNGHTYWCCKKKAQGFAQNQLGPYGITSSNRSNVSVQYVNWLRLDWIILVNWSRGEQGNREPSAMRHGDGSPSRLRGGRSWGCCPRPPT